MNHVTANTSPAKATMPAAMPPTRIPVLVPPEGMVDAEAVALALVELVAALKAVPDTVTQAVETSEEVVLAAAVVYQPRKRLECIVKT